MFECKSCLLLKEENKFLREMNQKLTDQLVAVANPLLTPLRSISLLITLTLNTLGQVKTMSIMIMTNTDRRFCLKSRR